MNIFEDTDIKSNIENFRKQWIGNEEIILWNSNYDKKIVDKINWEGNNWGKDYFMISTSGSTGIPKIIVASKERASRMCETIVNYQGIMECKDIIVSLPLTYSYAFVNQFLIADLYSKNLIVTEGLSNPSNFIEKIQSSVDSMICLVGSQLSILEKHISDKTFNNVKVLNFAGGRYPHSKISLLRDIFPNAQIYNNYGCTEAVPRLSITESNKVLRSNHIGKPIKGVSMRIDQDNELFFKSEYKALGILSFEGSSWKRSDLTEWTRTGDKASYAENEGYTLIGRTCDSFKRYGEFVRPEIITQYFSKKFDHDCYYYIDEDKNQEVGLVILLETEVNPVLIRDTLREYVRQHNRSMLPLRIEFLEQLPRLPNGKVPMLNLSMIEKLNPQALWKLI